MSETSNRVRQLPRVQIIDFEFRGKTFYVDERLNEIRNVIDPHERYDIGILDRMGHKVVLCDL